MCPRSSPAEPQSIIFSIKYLNYQCIYLSIHLYIYIYIYIISFHIFSTNDEQLVLNIFIYTEPYTESHGDTQTSIYSTKHTTHTKIHLQTHISPKQSY